MNDPHWSQTMLPRERIEQLENVNRELRQQLEQAEARVAELESEVEFIDGIGSKLTQAATLRKQAEAVEEFAAYLDSAGNVVERNRAEDYAQRLRSQADELEQ